MSSEARPQNRVKKKVSFVGIQKKPAFGLLQFITLKVKVYIRTVSSYLIFSFDPFNFFIVWAEIEYMVHVIWPKLLIN